ncbi:N-acetyl-gamma-glutamyl-phosphate reductase [Cognatilysobacter bugurensis]|uniref:N-acetyl-gamma-glutamyl-phosphate reductase n=1 Tax=Cognatilysobacter bugurensis TaxID=543356 RepID=A0A918SVA6_9GAMM|nr:N-acetyl-gamma-glutamyl-phosphate reductase [Lysobacter bugurensis]GHA73587.1 N-acetyl-gamma-glutamyl-phosphate reductase [Lysobacter bugurensis]
MVDRKHPIRVGLVGARGYVGAELIKLLSAHPAFELAYVGSRELDGQRLGDHHASYTGELRFSAPALESLPTLGADAVVLALPNGKAGPAVAAFDAAGADPVIVDLSADYRFDERWFYGLPELTRRAYAGQRRISNPGCYATAMQLAVAPLLGLLAGAVQCFGVSGYSGAGTSPSDKNDPRQLRDNLMPYALTGHIHEREVTRRLGHPVEFMPHVAPHFRGLTVTANLHLAEPATQEHVRSRYRARYADEPLVQVSDAPPWVSRIACTHGVEIGGFALDETGHRLVVVATLDNLLKGAATQALQNLNLAFGLDEWLGIPLPLASHADDAPLSNGKHP